MKRMVKMLTQKVIENGFQEFKMEMTNGDIVTVTPCCYVENPESVEQIEWYLVSGKMPWMGGPTLESIAKEFVEYEKNLKEEKEEKIKLRAYFEEHILPKKNNPDWKSYEDEDFGYYSDWHKDVYGFRPRGFMCGNY